MPISAENVVLPTVASIGRARGLSCQRFQINSVGRSRPDGVFVSRQIVHDEVPALAQTPSEAPQPSPPSDSKIEERIHGLAFRSYPPFNTGPASQKRHSQRPSNEAAARKSETPPAQAKRAPLTDATAPAPPHQRTSPYHPALPRSAASRSTSPYAPRG